MFVVLYACSRSQDSSVTKRGTFAIISIFCDNICVVYCTESVEKPDSNIKNVNITCVAIIPVTLFRNDLETSEPALMTDVCAKYSLKQPVFDCMF